MSKVLVINFEKSEEHLYKWLINHKNYEDVIKRLIDEEIKITEIVKEESKNDRFYEEARVLICRYERDNITKDEFREILEKCDKSTSSDKKIMKNIPESSLNSKDLDDLFGDDSFWN